MNPLRTVFVLIVGVVAGGCAGTSQQIGPASTVDAAVLERQIIVAVHQKTLRRTSQRGGRNRYVHRRNDYRASAATERALDGLAGDYGLKRVDGWLIRSLDVYCEVFEKADSPAQDAGENRSVADLLDALSADPRVELAQPVNLFATLMSHYDDPLLEMQSAVAQLQVEEAHRWATGRGVTVAIVDSGVDVGHPDLRGQVGKRRDFITGQRSSAVGEIHGTAVAGVIASVVNNQEGIIGVSPDVRIHALRACRQSGVDDASAQCSSFTLAQALAFAVEQRPDILNLSIAGPPDPLLSRLLDQLLRAGTIVIAAYPDDQSGRADFPGGQAGVIVAHSQSRFGRPAPPAVVAPGNAILTTTPGDGYRFLSGSSLAAAHVSGVAALLLERQPELSPDELVALMTATGNRAGTSINACDALVRLLGEGGCTTQVAQH